MLSGRSGSGELLSSRRPGPDSRANTIYFHYIILLMLDLSFVRDNLPRIEEMLRNRGMDPGTVLKDFHIVDAQRRQAINAAETLKAHRNRLSEEIAALKKSGQDA